MVSYRGVLLCDRPAAPAISSSSPQGAFYSGRAEGALGLGPSREANEHSQQVKGQFKPNEQPDTALTKHRKWLKEKEREKHAKEDEDLIQKLEKDIAKDRLKEVQSEHRKKILYGEESAPSESSSTRSRGSSKGRNKTPPLRPPRPGSGPKAKAKPKMKPKWAMTEDEALEAELAQGMELTKFAEDLDIDAYLDDYAVQEALAIIQEKVDACSDDSDESQAERQRVIDETDDVASMASYRSSSLPAIERKAKVCASPAFSMASGSVVHDKDWDISQHRKKMINLEALRLAEKLLEKNPNLKAVHSKHSMAKVLEELTKRQMQESREERE